jgi:methylation protein EvaC
MFRPRSDQTETLRLKTPHGTITEPYCSFCDSRDLGPVMDFGEVALAGGFLKPDAFAEEPRFRLRLQFCRNCLALQVVDHVPADVMFHDYFYFSSSIGTLRSHFQRYAVDVTRRFLSPAKASVLEFGCNDGVLLRPLADQGICTVIGVDPATNVVTTINDPRIKVVNDYFTEAVAERVVAEHGPIDMIVANNVYAHIRDIQGTTRATHRALADDGVFVFEVHYLGKVIGDMQYDMVYHEHLYYYSLLSAENHFRRHGMKVFDVEPVPIHAGSMRFSVCKEGSRHAKNINPSVIALAENEREKGYDRYETFVHYSDTIAATRTALMTLLQRLRQEGKRIAGYGASGRANTMIQYCGITHVHLDYMIDDAPAKAGFFTPGSHFEIRSSEALRGSDAPDYVLIFAWSFFDEIRRRNEDYLSRGGRMILPLPVLQVFPPSP